MNSIAFPVLVLLTACCVMPAQAVQKIVARGNPAARLGTPAASANATVALPTYEEIHASIANLAPWARVTPESVVSISRPELEKIGCQLDASTPSGVERTDGTPNGVTSLYRCPNAYLVAYELDYTLPTTQLVAVVDDEYASDPVSNRFAIKQFHARGEASALTTLRWLNPEYEIRYEIFHDPGATKWVADVKAALLTTAHQLAD